MSVSSHLFLHHVGRKLTLEYSSLGEITRVMKHIIHCYTLSHQNISQNKRLQHKMGKKYLV